jgi:anti-sigma B factor antagonist
MRSDDDAAPFAVVVTHHAPSGIEVLVVGELDLHTSPQLVRAVLGEMDHDPNHVSVVLNGVTFVDSTGMVALLEVRDALAAAGCSLVLMAPSDPVRFVLDLSGLASEFTIEP